MKDRVRLYEKQAAVLESVAKQYSSESAEYRAVRQGAIALWYGLSQQRGDFLEYMEQWERGELTAKQKARLKSMGIDPEAEPGRKSGPRSRRQKKG